MTKRRLVEICMLFCMCFLLLPCTISAVSTVNAAEPISLTTDCTLTAVYSYNNTAFSGISVSVYRIADVSEDCRYTYTDEFEACALPLNGMQSDSEWDSLRSTLEAYILVYKPEPYATAVTDDDGRAYFDKLEPGLYFIPSVQYSSGGNRYSFSCSLTALPGLDQKDGTWDYTIQVKPKPEVKTDEAEKIPYKVIKLWKDAGNEYARPESITIDIYKDGELVNTVSLSEDTNWSYQWDAEDDGSVWTVMERNVPEGYVMTLGKHGGVFVITNVYTETPDETEETDDETETGGGGEESPQTGDTFHVGMYIAIMCVSGCMLILLGITGKRKTE